MKKTTKRNLNILAISTLTLGSLFAVGASLGKYISSNKNNFIKFELNDDSVTLDNNEVTAIESIIWNKNNSDNKTSNKLTRDSSSSQTTSQITADVITTMFMEYSLTGSTTFDLNVFEQLDGHILSPDSESSWVAPRISDYETLYELSNYIEVFNKTTGAQPFVDFWVFATEVLESSSDMTLNQLAAGFTDKGTFKTFFDAQHDSEFSNLVTELGNKLSYKKTINDFLYIYSYLWQESSREGYDFFLTEEMIKMRPSLVWSINFSKPENSFSGDVENIFSTIDEDTSLSGRASSWNDIIDGVTAEGISSNKFSSLTESGFRGYDGMVGKNTSSLVVDSNFWSYDEVWDFETYSEDGKIVLNDDYSKKYPNLYKNDLGEYVNKQEESTTTDPDNPDETTSTPESYYVYQNFLFYPFAFPEDYNIEIELAKKWNYSLVAYENPSGEIQLDYEEGKNLTKINYFDYMFSDIDISSDTEKDSEIIELYLISSLFNLDSADIKNRAYSYWKSKGFYIELSGKYQDKYEDLIPAGLQK